MGRWPVDSAYLLDISLYCTMAPHADARRDIVNMLLDVSWDVVFLTGDVCVGSRTVLPDIEIGY